MRIRKAVFPVGGLGTRFLPATKAMPKEMLPIVDKPLIQYAVEDALEAGVEQFIFVTGRGKSALEDHFDRAHELEQLLIAREKNAEYEMLMSAQLGPGQVSYVRQQEPLGLGHAIWCARHLVGDEPFAVLLPDDLIKAERSCMAQMAEAHAEVGGGMVAVMDVPREHTRRYGVLDPGADDGRLVEVRGLVEKPEPEKAPSRLSIIGRYILTPEVMRVLERNVAERRHGVGGEVQLTDAMAETIGATPFHGLRFAGERFDCGDKAGFVMAQIAFGLSREDVGPAVRDFARAHV